MDENKCSCGEEATKGCHAVQDGIVVDKYFCDICFNKGVSWTFEGGQNVSH